MEGFPEFFTTLGPRPSMTKNVSDSKAQQQKQPHHNQHQTHLKTQCDDPNNNKLNGVSFNHLCAGCSGQVPLWFLFVVACLLCVFYFCFALCYRLIFARSFCSFSRSFCLLSRLFNPLSSHFVVLRLKQKNKTDKLKKIGRMDWLIDGWRDKPTNQRASR